MILIASCLSMAFACWMLYELLHPADQTDFDREHEECIRARKEKDEEACD